MTTYYIAHEDADVPAVYLVDGEWLAHTVPDWEAIEGCPSRVWRTSSKYEAMQIAGRYKHFGARVAICPQKPAGRPQA
jgi:hypothetical protein